MKWVLIDLSYLAHRARYAMSDLEYEDIPTGVMYGFFEQLLATCKNPPVCSNKILIFTDSKKSYRQRAFPDYKKKRKENRTPEEQEQIRIMYQQVNKLRDKILPKLGIPVYKQVGLESDDLIADAANILTERKEEAVIITADGDLYQCISPYVKWYDPGRELLMDENAFQEKYGIHPDQWGQVKSLAGCSSDGVPGLPGIGEKTALKYITGETVTPKRKETIDNSQEEIKKWEKLVILPHHKTKSVEIKEPEYKSKLFFKFAEHYNILTYLKPAKREQWIKFFRGNFKGKIKLRKKK